MWTYHVGPSTTINVNTGASYRGVTNNAFFTGQMKITVENYDRRWRGN